MPHPPVHLKTSASCGVQCAADIPTRIYGHVILYVHNNKMKTHVYGFVLYMAKYFSYKNYVKKIRNIHNIRYVSV